METLGEIPLEDVFERFDDALAFLRARTPMPSEQFYSLDDQARLKAFTVSNAGQMNVIQQVLDSLDKAVETGQDLGAWKAEIGPALQAAWAGSVERPGYRMELIYRNATQQAFSHGRVRQMRDPSVTALRPYWLYDAVNDSRTSDICSARDGVLLLADDPWWASNTPPGHHACRSGIRSLRKSQADRRGGVNPPDREVELSPPGKGFGAAPSLDPGVQVAPWRPDVKGHPALEGARLRKEAEFQRAEEERLRALSARREQVEAEARSNPYTAEELERLPRVEGASFRNLTAAQKKAGKAAAEQSREFAQNITPAERSAIAAWSDGYDATIRRIQGGYLDDAQLLTWRRRHVLETGKPETEEQSRQHVADAHQHRVALERALAGWHGIESAPKRVYRGMGGFTGEAIRRLLLTGEIELRGQTTSATWDPFMASLFERNAQEPDAFGVVLRLTTRSGMPIETISENPTEFELLLRGDLRFRITGTSQLIPEHGRGDAAGVLLIDAEEIG